MVPMYPVAFGRIPSVLDGVFTSFWNCDDAAALTDQINGNDVADVVAPGSVAGKVNLARDFNGTTQYFFDPSSAIIGTAAGVNPSFAFCGWFYNRSVAFGTGSILFFKNAPNFIVAVTLLNVAAVATISLYMDNLSGGSTVLNTFGDVPDNQWVWFYIAYDASVNTAYVSYRDPIGMISEDQSTVTGWTFGAASDDDFSWGAVYDGTQKYNGMMDALGYKEGGVLTAPQLDAHYNAGVGIQYPF